MEAGGGRGLQRGLGRRRKQRLRGASLDNTGGRPRMGFSGNVCGLTADRGL